jgi:hypothetical protein
MAKHILIEEMEWKIVALYPFRSLFCGGNKLF